MSGDADPPAVQHESSAASVPRKRRKRTTAGGGAADDCFTCAAAGQKCDRRRPYCSQCLEHGRDCAGYKTTLTWGVGVASRGKLRGLSLPVSDGPGSKPPPSAVESGKQPAAISSSTTTRPPASTLKQQQQSLRKRSATRSPPTITSTLSSADPDSFVTTSPHDSRRQSLNWSPSVSWPAALHAFQHVGLLDGHDGGAVYNYNNASSAAEVPFSAAQGWAFPSASAYPEYHQPDYQTGIFTQPVAATDQRRESSIKHEIESREEALVSADQFPVLSNGHNWNWKFMRSPFANSLPDILLEQSVGRTPRMRYLISYFAEVIAPVIVAFDRPSNPFRTRVLRLAHHSETLQHAIAALSASNIRQRREEKILSTERTAQARQSSMAHRVLTDASFQERHGVMDLGGENREEVYHKSMAIKSLNALLADPSKRHHDSVLASLFILCLFHGCETGVAQFQTQFAGVRKLLAMRHRSNVVESEESRWCMRMFTWFDALTAAINNREGQLQGLYLDATCLSDEEWALENLTGCDGRLFKTVARLGRLNILSQNRPVDPSYHIDMPVAVPVIPPSLSHYTSNGMNPAYAPALYTNPQAPQGGGDAEFWMEWHTIRQQLETWRLDLTVLGGYDVNNPFQSSPNSSASLSSSANSGPTATPSPTTSTSSAQVSQNNLADLSNTSEAFRYSALLYTERLAHPTIPSTHARIQTLVITAMHYIAAIQSDVYLLWPLFITGSECVYEEHRTAIRNRCRDIQKDSGFYNNISCLELLEKIWSRNPAVSSNQPQYLSEELQSNSSVSYLPHHLYTNHGFSGSPVSNIRAQPQDTPLYSSIASTQQSHGFRWQSVIEDEGVDGEYMVV